MSKRQSKKKEKWSKKTFLAMEEFLSKVKLRAKERCSSIFVFICNVQIVT